MSRQLLSQVTVDAPVQEVWRRLTEVRDYATWNPVLRFHGPLRAGAWVVMSVRLNGLWLVVPVRIECMDVDRELRWVGGLPGLYQGRHWLRLTPTDDVTLVEQGEVFTGVAVPALFGVLRAELEALHGAVNQALAAAVTSTGRQSP